MQKAYNPIKWENAPSENTPLNERNLNKIDVALDEVDNRVLTIDLTKMDKTSASGMLTGFELNTETGVITLTYYDGSNKTINTNLAKIALNISYDAENERLVLAMPDGTVEYVDMTALITEFEFVDSDTIAFEVTADGNVKAKIKNGSITPEMLQPDYLASINVQVENATASATAASASAVVAQSYSVGNTGTRENENTDNAKHYYEQAKQISQGINGITPMGTITFSNLPTENIVKNAMYNVSDAFTSDERFNDGGGIHYGPGNNVIWTAEGKWDVTASSSVTGIKGETEECYRQGNVNITAENVGALPKEGTAVDSMKINGYSIVVLSESEFANLPSKDEKTFYCRPKE